MSRLATLLLMAGVGAAAACAGILGLRDDVSRPFEHRAHVVSGISCVHCHARVAKGDATTPLDLPNDASCLTCHAQPHDTRACGSCHGSREHRDRVAQAKDHLRFSHAAHQGVSEGQCTRCHEGVLANDRPLRPTMATCLSCHEHREQWAGRSCSPCHVRMEEESTRPESHVVHGRNFLERHGLHAAGARDLCSTCHAESECAECHGTNVAALPSMLRFDEPRRAELHGAGFFARHSIEARIDPATCTSCHAADGSCRDCHERSGLLRVTPTHASPHPPDWVGTRGSGNRHGPEARRDPLSCASCHGGGGEALCVGCHRVGGAGGSPHAPGFRSQKTLTDLPCRMCHNEAGR